MNKQVVVTSSAAWIIVAMNVSGCSLVDAAFGALCGGAAFEIGTDGFSCGSSSEPATCTDESPWCFPAPDLSDGMGANTIERVCDFTQPDDAERENEVYLCIANDEVSPACDTIRGDLSTSDIEFGILQSGQFASVVECPLMPGSRCVKGKVLVGMWDEQSEIAGPQLQAVTNVSRVIDGPDRNLVIVNDAQPRDEFTDDVFPVVLELTLDIQVPLTITNNDNITAVAIRVKTPDHGGTNWLCLADWRP